MTVQHIYDEHDTYTVTVTASDLSGESASASTVIVVQPVVILTLAATKPVSGTVTFTATVSPSDTVVATYVWDFGDGQSLTTSTDQISHFYSTPGVRNVTVTATTLTGRRASASTTVNIPTLP
jgi:PKD repeat protein